MKKSILLLPLIAALAVAGCTGEKTATSSSPVAANSDSSVPAPDTSVKPPPASVVSATDKAPNPPSAPAPTPPKTAALSSPGQTPGATTAAVKPAKTTAPAAGPGLIGSWKGEMKMPPMSKSADPKQQQAMDMVKSMMNNLTLDLNANHRFKLTMMMPMEGTWSSTGNILSLKMETFMGMTIDQVKSQAKQRAGAATNPAMMQGMDQMSKPMEFTISPDHKTLTAKPKGQMTTQQGSLTFKKN